MCKKNDNATFAFIFDSGELEIKSGSSDYGSIVFNSILKGKEISHNKIYMNVYIGDILATKFIDIETYVTNDDFCSINFDKKKSWKDYPFCWLINNLSYNIAKEIDIRLKKEFKKEYIGVVKIDFSSKDKRKRFWEGIPFSFSIYKKKIFCSSIYGEDSDYSFQYESKAIELGYRITYKNFEEPKLGCVSNKKENFNQKQKFSVDSIDRNIAELNFMLCREFQVAGALIWRSINDIDKVNFFQLFEDKKPYGYLVEYSFFALYHAAQGIERIQKIIVEMICKKHHLKKKEKDKVFNILIKHNHNALNDWINNKEKLNLNSNALKLLNILECFYNKIRYYRYSDEENSDLTPEYAMLFNLKTSNDSSNYNSEIKNTFGKMLGQLTNSYYKLFRKLCDDLNVYSYELDSESSAYLAYYFDDDNKDNLYESLLRKKRSKREVIYWIIKNGNKINKYKKNNLKPLDFDKALIDEYITELIDNPEDGYCFYDTVSEMYDEICNNNKNEFKKRLSIIDHIFSGYY